MSARLTHNAYGKARVRLTHLDRSGKEHVIHQLIVDVELEGDFQATYHTGDNTGVVATDSMKNTVYVLAKERGIGTIEDYALALAGHFVKTYAQVSRSTVRVAQEPWEALTAGGKKRGDAFVGGGSEQPTCRVVHDRKAGASVSAGLEGLLILRSAGSGFSGFVRDRYTTLRDTDDRIFATVLSANWDYSTAVGAWDDFRAKVRHAMLKAFADGRSDSVQQTLYAMGQAALEACGAVKRVTLAMPNKHHLLVNLEPFGLKNDNVVFMPTDEPYGLIKGTVERA